MIRYHTTDGSGIDHMKYDAKMPTVWAQHCPGVFLLYARKTHREKTGGNMKALKIFLSAVLAGMTIGIGGTVYLSVDNSLAGALLFTVGLYAICTQGLHLFTGKAGYIVEHGAAYLFTLLIIWLGNLVGTGLVAIAVRSSRICAIASKAGAIAAIRMNDGMPSLFLLAILCGLLMYTAVEGYRKTQNPLILFCCVAAFILCGFEHCIADMYYFSAAAAWNARSAARILVITSGNLLGCALLPLYHRLPD